MTSHTCHTPFCWLLSCAVCASCAACAATLTPARLVDDPAVSPDDPLRTAVEVLGATPTGDEAPDDALLRRAAEAFGTTCFEVEVPEDPQPEGERDMSIPAGVAPTNGAAPAPAAAEPTTATIRL